ncbi:MAG: sulfite exporter TauE/SafE family protein [Candidatus Eremiobacteraeota bacterium]|nr:sulfite exporter TauE/SafE family protein [Candidatus Eremiobacteraeota bacterium]
MNVATIALDLGLGAVIGAMGGLFGIGGGIIAIPALVLVFGMHQQTAEGTALVAIVPNTLVGLWSYARRDRLDPRIAFALASTATISSAAFASLALGWNERALGIAFASFLAVVASWILWGLVRKLPVRGRPLPSGWSAIVGAIGGGLSGIFGIGGATVTPPAMTALFGIEQTAAQGYALALVAPGSIAALVTFARAGHVDWLAGFPLAVGGAFAVPFGVSIAHRLSQRRLKTLFALLVLSTSLVLVIKSI